MAFLTDKPFSEIHGSVRAELIARASNDHPIFGDDNAKISQFLEEATRDTPVASTIASWKRTKDGRRAFFAIVAQHAGSDKWEILHHGGRDFLKEFKV